MGANSEYQGLLKNNSATSDWKMNVSYCVWKLSTLRHAEARGKKDLPFVQVDSYTHHGVRLGGWWGHWRNLEPQGCRHLIGEPLYEIPYPSITKGKKSLMFGGVFQKCISGCSGHTCSNMFQLELLSSTVRGSERLPPSEGHKSSKGKRSPQPLEARQLWKPSDYGFYMFLWCRNGDSPQRSKGL